MPAKLPRLHQLRYSLPLKPTKSPVVSMENPANPTGPCRLRISSDMMTYVVYKAYIIYIINII
jgi:hypothetical protein